MIRAQTTIAFILAFTAAGCASGGGEAPVTPNEPSAPGAPGEPPATTLPSAPWSGESIDRGLVPQEYLTAWQNAENRDRCALLAPRDVRHDVAAARRATFSGGWGVAYDMPELRSAFGVAGTGASAHGDLYDEWPNRIEWSDGSVATYGPEGGTGPNTLAYLVIPGQDCLYNVWSRFGAEHVEFLLGQLRYVE